MRTFSPSTILSNASLLGWAAGSLGRVTVALLPSAPSFFDLSSGLLAPGLLLLDGLDEEDFGGEVGFEGTGVGLLGETRIELPGLKERTDLARGASWA